MPRVCVFDVNETLLDLAALDPHLQRVFGSAGVRREWFSQLLQSAVVATVTDVYSDVAALEMVAARHSRTLYEEEQQSILGGMRQLPAHPDVRESLDRLRGTGVRLATLTNSPSSVAETQLAHAGLRDLFEQALSADAVHRLKPAPEPYHMAADALGVGIGEIRLIAAHAWDVAGALRAGCAAAFVARPGQVLDPLAPRPDVVGSDLREVVDHIVRREGLASA